MKHMQAALAILAVLALLYVGLFNPPRTIAGKVDAILYCRAEATRLYGSPSEGVNFAKNLGIEDTWKKHYVSCMSESKVDNGRLAIQVVVIVVAGIFLLFAMRLYAAR